MTVPSGQNSPPLPPHPLPLRVIQRLQRRLCPTRAAALVSVGLMDTIGPPSTVFGAFNALGSTDKTICEYAFNDHEGGVGFQEREQAAWLAGRL